MIGRLRRRARWVHPSTHEIFKFLPHTPPLRGEIVLELGKKLEAKFDKVEVTPEIARIFVGLVLDDDYGVDEITYVDERFQRVGDDGKVEYAEYEEVVKQLEADLVGASTVEEMLGLALRVMLAGRFAKNPQRASQPYPYYGGSYWLPESAGKKLDALARRERVVPKALKEAATP